MVGKDYFHAGPNTPDWIRNMLNDFVASSIPVKIMVDGHLGLTGLISIDPQQSFLFFNENSLLSFRVGSVSGILMDPDDDSYIICFGEVPV